MSSRAGAIARAFVRGVADPRLPLLALRERGFGFVLERLVHATPEKLDDMVHGLEVRSSPDTLADLLHLFNPCLVDVADEDAQHYRVTVRGGPVLLIRKAVCVSDMRVVEETFVRDLYAEHPPLDERTVLDVGANLGDTSVYYARKGARVIAYEPSKELCDLAVRNAALNGLDIEVHQLGIGCDDCMLEMAIGPRGATQCSMTVFPDTQVPDEPILSERAAIHVVPLADVLARIGPVFFLKMDCEGCEYPALLSLSTGQLRTIEHVFMEYHGSPDPLRRKLEESGFTVRFREWKLLLADRIS
ncbi:MAG: FkbM family methyltransferase [Candidatus Eremiobacteraeota bacterium]|nr:FkbM family methyltransferase [Candidatus Eremiobacteraeota bacterium]